MYLEQSKKRDHKIYITDIAIKKVEKINIADFTQKQNNFLNQVHEEVLRIAKEKNNSDEVAIVYNLHTLEKVIVLGETDYVNTEENIEVKALQHNSYMQELVMSHNHPSTTNFSFADIDYFINNDFLLLLSVVTNQGEVYLLIKTDRYDYNKIVELENGLIKKYTLTHQNEIAEKFINECYKGGIEYVKGK